jgi:hypothetical protein
VALCHKCSVGSRVFTVKAKIYLFIYKLLICASNLSREADERRQMMLSQILSAEARERRKFKSEISSCSCLLGPLFVVS